MLLFAFVLLLVSFRSIVIALKAIVLNLLSVAAAYGVLVAIFQWGWGENLLDFQSNGGIANWLPMFMFVILFGLSMDYHVFILSRIREAYDRGLSTDDAISHGIKSTAGVVTSAAVVMVGVFSVFAMLPLVDLKEMGIGLAVAVLIDATIVRAVLLPGHDEAARRARTGTSRRGSSGCRGSSTSAREPGFRPRQPASSRPPDRVPAPHPRGAGPHSSAHDGRHERSMLMDRNQRPLPSDPRLAAAPPRLRTEVGSPGSRSASSPCTSSTTPSCSRTPGRPPPTTSSAASSRSRCSSPRASLYPRLRAGARATTALLAGFFGVLVGTRGGALHACRSGPRATTTRACSSILAGLVLLGLGARDAVAVAPPRRPRLVALRAGALLLAVGAARRRVRRPVPGPIALRRHARPARATCRRPTSERRYEDVTFTTSDGLRLKGWYIPSRNGAAVISFPGRAARRSARELLARHGYGVLLFDRRGEGESEGDPNLFGWQGERDIHAAVAFLQGRPDVDPERIGGIGLSVGGEMMIEAAAESTALKAIVSEGASGRSVRDVVANPGATVAGGPRQRRRDRGDRRVHGQRAAGRPREPRAEDLAARRSSSTARTASRPRSPPTGRSTTAARGPKEIWEVPGSGHIGGVEGAAARSTSGASSRSSTARCSAGRARRARELAATAACARQDGTPRRRCRSPRARSAPPRPGRPAPRRGQRRPRPRDVDASRTASQATASALTTTPARPSRMRPAGVQVPRTRAIRAASATSRNAT